MITPSMLKLLITIIKWYAVNRSELLWNRLCAVAFLSKRMKYWPNTARTRNALSKRARVSQRENLGNVHIVPKPKTKSIQLRKSRLSV